MNLQIGILIMNAGRLGRRHEITFFNDHGRRRARAGVRKGRKRKRFCFANGLVRLSEMNIAERGTIREIRCPGPIRRRLLDMGIIPGVTVLMERRAPLGDPIEIKCRTFHVSLRIEEAQDIHVEIERGDSENSDD